MSAMITDTAEEFLTLILWLTASVFASQTNKWMTQTSDHSPFMPTKEGIMDDV